MIIGKIRDKINDKTDNNTVTVENLTERKTSNDTNLFVKLSHNSHAHTEHEYYSNQDVLYRKHSSKYTVPLTQHLTYVVNQSQRSKCQLVQVKELGHNFASHVKQVRLLRKPILPDTRHYRWLNIRAGRDLRIRRLFRVNSDL